MSKHEGRWHSPAACDGSQSRPGDPCASPGQRSPPPSGEELPPPQDPRPQELPPPTSASHALCLLTGPRLGRETASPQGAKETHTQVETRCKARGSPPAHPTTGATAAPTLGCPRAADTHVWQEGEALGALSLPDCLGHTPRVCLATRPEARSVCLVPDRRVSEEHLIFQTELPPSEPAPRPPRSLWPRVGHSPAAAGCGVTAASGRSSRRRPVPGARLSHTLRPPACN